MKCMNNTSIKIHKKKYWMRKDLYRCTDSLLVMLNISTYCSVIPYIIFHQYQRGWCMILLSFINVLYLLTRFHGKVKIPTDTLFFIYISVLLSNIIAVLTSGDESNVAFIYPFINSTFYVLIFTLYYDYKKSETKLESIWLVIRGYIWLCALGIVSAISLFILIKAGFNPTTTPVADEYYDLFKSNAESTIRTYYFPYYISVLLDAGIITKKIPFFMEYGTICGIFHEPNAICFVVFPALFFLWFYERRVHFRLFYFFIWVFIILLTGSTTNIIAFLFSIIVLLIMEKKARKWLIPLSVIALYLIIYIGLDNTELVFILDKLNDADGSMSYSSGTIEFAFTPSTLFGSNFLNNSYLTDISSSGKRDVGYLSFFLNIVFLSLFIFRLGRTIIKSKQYRLLGIAALYFFLHSMKTALVTYTNPLLLLMMFVLYVVEKRKSY